MEADADAEPGIGTRALALARMSQWARLLIERLRLVSEGATRAASALESSPSAAVQAIQRRIDAVHAELTAHRRLPEQNRSRDALGRVEVLCDLPPWDADLLLVTLALQLEPELAERACSVARSAFASGAHDAGAITLDLVARLLDPDEGPMRALERMRLFAPLRLHRLLDGGRDTPRQGLEVPEPVVAALLGRVSRDDRLRATSHAITWIPIGGVVAEASDAVLLRALTWCRGGRNADRRLLVLHGPDRRLKEALVADVARTQSREAMRVDLRKIGIAFREPELALLDHFRDCTLSDALPYVDAHACDDLPEEVRLRCAAAIDVFPRPLVIGHEGGAPLPLPVEAPRLSLHVAGMSAAQRAAAWALLLEREGVTVPAPEVLSEIARRHAIDLEGLLGSVTQVAGEHALVEPRRRPPPASLLDTAARRHLATTVGRYATRVEPSGRWEDLVVPEATRRGLEEMVGWVTHGALVFGTWGFGQRFGSGTSLTALFSGPPGTGKTMAASLVATRLARELYVIDVARVTSMWIGETEKNLGALFDQAARGELMLLFDEADSLFARRTEVRTSSDRYANLGVNYLLQRLEAFEGIAVLTTNRFEAIDEAFRRRLRFRLEFPMPDATERARLWQTMLPSACRLDDGDPPDWAQLGARYELSGGHIKNALLRAAFAAAERGSALSHELVTAAANEEYRTLGRVVRERR